MTLPRIFTSSKFQASFLATALAAIPTWFTLSDKNLDRAHKQEAATKFVWAVAGIWGIAIAGTAHEDAAGKKANGPAQAPDVQVNTGDAAQNVQQPVATFSPGVAVNAPSPPLRRAASPPQSAMDAAERRMAAQRANAKAATKQYQPTFTQAV